MIYVLCYLLGALSAVVALAVCIVGGDYLDWRNGRRHLPPPPDNVVPLRGRKP